MRLFNRIRHIRRALALALSDPKAWDRTLWNLIGSQSVSGENVTEYTALTYSAFWNAVQLIAGTVASLPLHLMRQNGKSKEFATDRSLYNIMRHKWNPIMPAAIGRRTLMSHVLVWGNGYAEKVLDGYGKIAGLWPITPDRVTPMLKNGELKYRILMQGEADIELPREKILHIPGPGYDGLVGYSIVALARKSIGLGMAMETFGSLYFGKGTHPAGIIEHPGTLKDPKAFREATSEVYAGLGKSHQLMILENGMKFTPTNIPPEDSQFLESRQFQVPEIARWFNLPPHKLKDLTKSSFNNIEQEQISFVTDSILPWLVGLEECYWMQLLNPAEQKENFYFKHNIEGLLRADAKSRAEFYQIMKRNGIMTINEIRNKEDLNPHSDPLADELWTESNMAPLSNWPQMQQGNQGNESQTQLEKASKFPALVEAIK